VASAKGNSKAKGVKSTKKDDFIDELNAVGAESKRQHELLISELKEDLNLGIIAQEKFDELVSHIQGHNKEAHKTPPVKQAVIAYEEFKDPFELTEDGIVIHEFLPMIMMNIPNLARGLIQKKFIWNAIDNNRFTITKIITKNKDVAISEVFYTTAFGSRINVDLNYIYDFLQRIDFEED